MFSVVDLNLPTAPSARCTALFKQALLELSCISEVAAAHVGAETARLRPLSSIPKGSRGALTTSLERKWARCTSEYERLLVIREAQQAIRSARHKPSDALIRGTSDWKLAIAQDLRPSTEVAEAYDVSSSYVRKIKGRFQEGILD
jgi:hypothetical protein